MTPQEFLDKFGPMCVAAMVVNGGFASVRLAQLIQEAGFSVATPRDIDTGRESYNLTGVKGVGPAGSVRAWTTEWNGTKYVDTIAYFRAYDSFEQHVMERDRIFEWSNYDAYRAAKTPEDACRALQNAPMPYATDPGYAAKLIAVIEEYDLKRFDTWPFADVPGDAWYADFVRRMKSTGVMNGYRDGYLRMSEESIRTLMMAERLIRSTTK